MSCTKPKSVTADLVIDAGFCGYVTPRVGGCKSIVGLIDGVVSSVRRFSRMSGEWHVVGGGDASRMNFEIIAGESIYRPRKVSEVKLRNRREDAPPLKVPTRREQGTR